MLPPSSGYKTSLVTHPQFLAVIQNPEDESCDLISYGLILLSLWICVLMVLARESIFRLGYFSGFFLFVVIILTIMLYCTFRRIG
jgi:hypothetical protein